MTDWSSAQVSDWVTTILTLIVAGAYCENTGVALKPWLDAGIDVMSLIALHIDHENYEPALVFDSLAKYFARIAQELYLCDLSPSLIVHQGFMTTNRIASAAMPFGLPKVIGDRMLTLSLLSAINTIVDLAGCFYIADDEISRLMQPILRKVTLLGSSGIVGLDRDISPHWVWLALPMSLIRELLSGSFNCSGFPCQQIKCGLTPFQSLLKLTHWMRQGIVEYSDESIGLLMWHPGDSSLDGRLKVQSGRGGQRHYHNIAYIGSSWTTVDNRGLPSGLFQLTASELKTAVHWDLPLSMKHLFGIVHCRWYQMYSPETLVNRHILVPLSLAKAFPCPGYVLNDDCEEVELAQVHASKAIEDNPVIADRSRPCMYLPPGIEVHLRIAK